MSQLDDIEARLNAATPGAITITPSDVHYLLTLAHKQAIALNKIRAAADYWAKLADGDKYYAKQIHDALGDNR